MIESFVDSLLRAGVVLTDPPMESVGVLREDVSAFVGRVSVDDDIFERRILLVENGADCILEKLPLIERGSHYRDSRKLGKAGVSFPMRKCIGYVLMGNHRAVRDWECGPYQPNQATSNTLTIIRNRCFGLFAMKTHGICSLALVFPFLTFALDSAERESGFHSLFDGKTFEGWEQEGNWVIEDDAFYRKEKGGSLTYTAELVPDDFELRFEWKVSKGCNSGVYYRPQQYEYQVLDNVFSPYGENPRQAAGSLFFCMAPSKDATKPFGEWNTGRIKCKGTVIEHWVNGERVLSFDYKDPKWAEEVELLRIRGADLDARGGKLWLQDHGHDVWFRNLRMREIPREEEVTADPDFVPMPVTGEALKKEQERVERTLKAQKE